LLLLLLALLLLLLLLVLLLLALLPPPPPPTHLTLFPESAVLALLDGELGLVRAGAGCCSVSTGCSSEAAVLEVWGPCACRSGPLDVVVDVVEPCMSRKRG
jgi:hypothetical protein